MESGIHPAKVACWARFTRRAERTRRRDVPGRTHPALLPAEDGFVAVMGVYDELGGGIDAVHVRCEMVTLPPAPR